MSEDDLAKSIRAKLDAGQPEVVISVSPDGQAKQLSPGEAFDHAAESALFQRLLSNRFKSSIILGTRMMGEREIVVSPEACLRGGWALPMSAETYDKMIATVEVCLAKLRKERGYITGEVA